MNHKEVRKMVYDKYPFSKSELKCAEEKRIMSRLREKYMTELYEQAREKRDWEGSRADKQAV